MRDALHYGMVAMPKKHRDTTISLHPMSFEEAIAKLADLPRRSHSEAEGSGSTTETAPETETSEPRTAPRQSPPSHRP